MCFFFKISSSLSCFSLQLHFFYYLCPWFTCSINTISFSISGILLFSLISNYRWRSSSTDKHKRLPMPNTRNRQLAQHPHKWWSSYFPLCFALAQLFHIYIYITFSLASDLWWAIIHTHIHTLCFTPHSLLPLSLIHLSCSPSLDALSPPCMTINLLHAPMSPLTTVTLASSQRYYLILTCADISFFIHVLCFLLYRLRWLFCNPIGDDGLREDTQTLCMRNAASLWNGNKKWDIYCVCLIIPLTIYEWRPVNYCLAFSLFFCIIVLLLLLLLLLFIFIL